MGNLNYFQSCADSLLKRLQLPITNIFVRAQEQDCPHYPSKRD
jgi:hypothetical protein